MSNEQGKIGFSIDIDTKRMTQELNRSKQQIRSFGNDVSAQGKRIDSEFSQMGNSIKSSITGAVGGAKNAVLDLTKSMLGLSAVAGSGAFLKSLYDDAKEFSKQMRIVSTISEDVTNNMQAFKNKVLDLTSQIAIAPATAAEALYQINSAGHLGAEGLKVLEASAKAAVAGVTETSTAADAITTVLNAYGLSADHATAISDKLFTTVRLGKTTMAELGHSIATVAPVAATFGVSIDEVLGVVSELTKQGVPTATAMTQIRSAITAVTESLGDGAFKTRGLLQAFEEVNTKAKGSENALKTDLGNIRALQAVLMATGTHASETADFIGEIADSTGATEVAFRKMNSTAGAQLTILRNNFLKEFQTMGDGMTSTLGGIASTLNSAFDSGAMGTTLSILKDLIIAYGVYKAIVITTNGVNTMMYNAQMSQMSAVLAAKTAEIDADLREAVSKGRLTAARAADLQAMRAEIAAKMEEVVATDRIAQAELATLTAKYEKMQTQVAFSKAKVAMMQQEYQAALATGNAEQIAAARTNLATAAKERNIIARKSSTAKIAMENAALKAEQSAQARATLATKLDTTTKQANSVATVLLTKVTTGLRGALNALKTAFATNPLGMIAMAATAIIGVLTTLSNETSDAATEIERFGESAAKQSANIDTLLAVMGNTASTSKVHKGAVSELIKIYEQYGIKIDDTINTTQQLIDKKGELIRRIQEEGEETRKANLIASYQEATAKATEKMRNALQEAISGADWKGTGAFFDMSADEYRSRAEELTAIVGSIMESEGENLAKLSGDAYERRLKEINKQIQQAYKDLGLEFEKIISDQYGNRYAVGTSINEVNILDEYARSISGIVKHREQLINATKKSEEATNSEAQAVDYTTMEFDKLFDAAYKTNEQIAQVDNTTATPKIDTSSIDAANASLNSLMENIAGIFGFNVSPNIDLSNIPVIGDLFAVTAKKAAQRQIISAQDALEQQIANAMQTRKGVADMLKNVNAKLENAVAGSDDEKRLLAIQRRLNAQKQKFDASGKVGGKTAAETNADIQKAQIESNKVLEESVRQRKQLITNLANQQSQNEIALEQDAREKRRKQLELDHKKEQEQLDNQLTEAINAEIERQRRLFDAREKEKKAANSKYVVRNFTDADLSQGEIENIRAQYKTLQEQMAQMQRKQQADLIRSDVENLRDYLANYGSYQQQRLAIAQEYAGKIARAQSEGERRSLQHERDSKMSGVRANELRETIDWAGVFGGFGSVFNSYLAPILADAKEYTKTAAFKNSDQASQKSLIEAINQMQLSLGGADKVSFSKLGDEINKYQQAQEKLKKANEDYEKKFAEWETATQAYTHATESGTETEIQIAEERKKAAERDMLAASDNVQALQTVAMEAQTTVSQTATTLKTSIDGVMGGLRGLASGGIDSAYKGFIQFGKSAKNLGALGDAFGKMADKLESIPVIGWVVEIVDIFKDGISVVLKGMIDAVFNAVTGILTDILNFKDGLFRQVGESLISGVGGIFKSIFTLGGLFDWMGGESDKNYEDDMQRLSATNEALKRAVEELTEVMKDTSVADADKLYQRQLELLRESEANTREELRRSGAAYNNGFIGIGGSRSSNYRINENMSAGEWARVSRLTGVAVNGATDFWNLTSEQMKKIADEAPDLYAKIKSLADDGYKDAAQYMDSYIEFAKQREELETAYYEKLTSYSFDEMRDEFKSALTDMEMSASDFADNFNELLVNSIAESLMTEKYDPLIKALYKKWAQYMEDGKLTDTEIATLQRDRQAIYDSMQTDREFLRTLSTSGGGQNSGSSKGFATASQDSINELNGRFTAIQMDTSIMREAVLSINGSMSAMSAAANEQRRISSEIHGISLIALDHLEAISKNTRELYEMNERLGKIETNTRNL